MHSKILSPSVFPFAGFEVSQDFKCKRFKCACNFKYSRVTSGRPNSRRSNLEYKLHITGMLREAIIQYGSPSNGGLNVSYRVAWPVITRTMSGSRIPPSGISEFDETRVFMEILTTPPFNDPSSRRRYRLDPARSRLRSPAPKVNHYFAETSFHPPTNFQCLLDRSIERVAP